MRITLIAAAVPPSSSSTGWQARVARQLAEAGHAVWWETVEGPPAWPDAVHLILRLERLLYRRRGERPPDHVAREVRGPRPDGGRPDLVVDLSGGVAGPPGALRLLYDGSPNPAAAVAALLDRRLVRLDAVLGDRVVASAWPGNEEPALLSAGLEALFARAADLCRSAVARIAARSGEAAEAAPEASSEVSPEAPPAAVPSDGPAFSQTGSGLDSARAIAFSTASLARKARGVLMRRLQRPEAWRVGLRRRDGASILDRRDVTPDGFGWLRDDGARYYADPFLHTHEGRTWLFVEEFPYATGKGVIAACEVHQDGTFGPTRVVLEEPVHLSYPLVFAQGGSIWMMPESSGSGELVLYRAVEFPWRWRRERILISGEALADATPVRHDGGIWIFATAVGLRGGSSCDALSLFHAPDLFGDFAPHPLNPVLIDAGSARPGGRMVRSGGSLLRVAQDCRTSYGAAAVVARVDRLDLGCYRQTSLARLTAPLAWAASGLHAVEIGERFEAVDAITAVVPPDAAGPGRSGAAAAPSRSFATSGRPV